MDWSKVKKTPKYNPWMFEVARNVRALSMSDVARRTELPIKTISQIEKGIVAPTSEHVFRISRTLAFPESFFQQWRPTKLDISGPLAKNIPIDYYQYPVFRKLNSQMQAV
jgi:transcriptional regulator with XRE-family HTH domain